MKLQNLRHWPAEVAEVEEVVPPAEVVVPLGEVVVPLGEVVARLDLQYLRDRQDHRKRALEGLRTVRCPIRHQPCQRAGVEELCRPRLSSFLQNKDVGDGEEFITGKL